MRERINRLARGIVELDVPRLSLSQESFEGDVACGELGSFDLLLVSENGIQMKGLLYSSHPKLLLRKNVFGGIRSKVFCEIDARECQEGEEISGELLLVSNAGERRIPFRFSVKARMTAGLLSSMYTAEEFAALCANDEALACRLFDYDDFCSAVFMQDEKLQAIYEGLKPGPDRKLALQEFLKALERGEKKGGGAEKEKKAGASFFRNNPFFKGFRRERDGEEGRERARHSLLPVLTDKELQDSAKVEHAASQYIREGETGPEAFRIYKKAIENGSSITRLYEYFLFSLPEDYDAALPREVYLYFAHENVLDDAVRLPLFYNILRYVAQDSDIYRRFERQIQEYAIEELLHSRIDDRLALIYDRMVYPDMVDRRIAEVLPAMLRTYRVLVGDSRMTAVVVRYLSYQREESYPVRNGVAYVPLFLSSYVLLFQDAYGNRYTSVPYEKKRILKKPALERRCFELNPDQPAMRLRRADQFARRESLRREELLFIEDVIETLDLSKQFRGVLLSAVLRHYDRSPSGAGTGKGAGGDSPLASAPVSGNGGGNAPGLSGEDAAGGEAYSEQEIRFLANIQPDALSQEGKESLVRALVNVGEYRYAYVLIKRYGIRHLSEDCIGKILHYMIGELEGEDSQELLYLAKHLFDAHAEDPKVLGYLLSHYNGLSADMLEVLRRAIALRGQDAGNAGMAGDSESAAEGRVPDGSAESLGGEFGRAGEERGEEEDEEDLLADPALHHEGENAEDGEARVVAATPFSVISVQYAGGNAEDGDVPQEAAAGEVSAGDAGEKSVAPSRQRASGQDAPHAEAGAYDGSSGGAAGIARTAVPDYDIPRFETGILDMAERLLAQMMFARTAEGLDEVLDVYRACQGSERNLFRAYMTVRSMGYFLLGEDMRPDFFRELYEMVHGENIKDRVPVIYLLALTKRLSEKEALSPEEKMEVQETLKILVEQKLVFAYTKSLGRFVPVPDFVKDRCYVEYHGLRDERPSMYIRIRPDEEDFHVVEMERVYQNIFVCALPLFAGEKAEYRIYHSDLKEPVQTGEVEAGEIRPDRKDSFSMLDRLSALSLEEEKAGDGASGAESGGEADDAEDEALKTEMLAYVRKAALIESLYGSGALGTH